MAGLEKGPVPASEGLDQANQHRQVRTDEINLHIVDVKSVQETIECRAQLGSPETDAVWQMFRLVTSGGITRKQWPQVNGKDSQAYAFICANRGAIFGPIPFVNGKSIQFDGANDRIDWPDNVVYDFDFQSEAASWNFWIKISDTTASVTYMEKQISNVGWRFHLVTDRLTLELRGTGGASDRIRVRSAVGFGALLNDGDWHMVTATMDTSGAASGVSLYLDGVALAGLDEQNDGLSNDTSNAAVLSLASRSGGGDSTGPCNIDEPSVWDVELSSANITTLYNSGVPIDLQDQGASPLTTSLQWWSRMGDGVNDAFPTIEDIESSLSGTMTNMTAGDIETVVPT